MTALASRVRRPVLAGNNQAACHVLDLLLEICSPDEILVLAPTEGGRRPWQTSVAAHALRRGVACTAPADPNSPETLAHIEGHGADILLSAYYTQIFAPQFLAAVDGPCLNFHPSLLPRHRGVAPLIWSIAEHDRKTGVTAHVMDEDVDAGEVVDQWPLQIHPEDTGYSLHAKAALLVRAMAARMLRNLKAGVPLQTRPQSGSPSYHTTKDPPLNHLDWSASRQRVRDVVRALAPPLPPAYGVLDGERLALARVKPVDRDPEGVRPVGMVTIRAGMPLVWASDGPVLIESFVENGEVRPGVDLVRSGRVTEGARLT